MGAWGRLGRLASGAGVLLAAPLGGCAPVAEPAQPAEPSAFLWLRYLHGQGTDGYATEADRMDTLTYYARSSRGLGGTPGTRAWPGIVPRTLQAFKRQFNIPLRHHGESVDAYRARTGAAVYYNRNELGLGRELVCSGPWGGADGPNGFLDSDGQSIGLACFVTNYGGGDDDVAFYDLDGAMRNATGVLPHAKNTVAITFRPTQAADDQGTQFWVYGSGGFLQDYALLDDDSRRTDDQARPVPSVCTECHGGTYLQDSGVARGAHFLPVDPLAVDTTWSRDGVQDRFRAWNCAAREGGSLTDAQRAYLEAQYDHDGGDVCTPGQTPNAVPVLPGWEGAHPADLWTKAVLPYCGSCHLAIDRVDVVSSYDRFTAMPVRAYVGTTADEAPTMPHALPAWHEAWKSGPVRAVDSDGTLRTFDSPGAFLLANLVR